MAFLLSGCSDQQCGRGSMGCVRPVGGAARGQGRTTTVRFIIGWTAQVTWNVPDVSHGPVLYTAFVVIRWKPVSGSPRTGLTTCPFQPGPTSWILCELSTKVRYWPRCSVTTSFEKSMLVMPTVFGGAG